MSGHLRTLVFVLFLIVAFVPIVSAWDDCPRGLVNDTYPGVCSRYTDSNKDGICDHSQPEPATGVAVVPASTEHLPAAAVIKSGTVPAPMQKTPVAPLPVVLITVCAGLLLFRKRQQVK